MEEKRNILNVEEFENDIWIIFCWIYKLLWIFWFLKVIFIKEVMLLKIESW